jgi:hypothetical protein
MHPLAKLSYEQCGLQSFGGESMRNLRAKLYKVLSKTIPLGKIWKMLWTVAFLLLTNFKTIKQHFLLLQFMDVFKNK